nr:MAG: efflux RND transporter periplasmic adaptor subunit [Pseudomonadota bacterium]
MSPQCLVRPIASSLSVLMFAAACSSASNASPSEPSRPEASSTRAEDGVVTVAPASRKFIRVEPAALMDNAAVLRAPARVAFPDGAVARVGAPLAGRVERVHVRTGDRVRPGDPLVTLDCPEAASIRAALSAARAAQREARATVERHARMMERGVGTERELLEAERRLTEAEAELSRALAAARFVGDNSGTTVVLRSPIAGSIVGRNVTVGAAVDPASAPLVEIGDPSEVWVVADVFERDLPWLREGMRATVELSSLPEPLSGKVAAIGTVVEGSARTAPVRILLERGDAQLRPGMFGRARIESDEQALALPVSAVLIKNLSTVVYVETAPGTFVRRPVAIGRPVDGRVVVRSGLVAGEPVVVEGGLLLDAAADQLL